MIMVSVLTLCTQKAISLADSVDDNLQLNPFEGQPAFLRRSFRSAQSHGHDRDHVRVRGDLRFQKMR